MTSSLCVCKPLQTRCDNKLMTSSLVPLLHTSAIFISQISEASVYHLWLWEKISI